MLSASAAKRTIKMCKVFAMNDMHCAERHLQPRAFIGSISLPSAVTQANTSQPKTKVLRHLKRGEYSIGSSRVNQTTRSVVRDFVHHILSTAERNLAISFLARRDLTQGAN